MKRSITVLLIIAIIIGALIGAGTWLKNEAQIEPVDYDAIMQQEYGEHDLVVIALFNRVKEYGVYVANCPEGTFIFGEDYEAYSTLDTACRFLFSDYTLEKIINGYTRVDATTGEATKNSGGFSEAMRESIPYTGEQAIRFQDLSQKAQYEIVQIAKEISDIVSPRIAEFEHTPSTAKFLKNADLLLLGKKEGFIHKKIEDSCFGAFSQASSYYKYYTTLNAIIESEDMGTVIKRDFEEGIENIESLIERIKNGIGNNQYKREAICR